MGSSVRANIKVMVSFPADSVWSKDTTVEQVTKQALESFRRIISNINTKSVQNGVKRRPYQVSIIGEPVVEVVFLELGLINDGIENK